MPETRPYRPIEVKGRDWNGVKVKGGLHWDRNGNRNWNRNLIEQWNCGSRNILRRE
jgi:hypothetical protein